MANDTLLATSKPNKKSKILAILTCLGPNNKLLGNLQNFIDIIQVGKQMGFIVYVLPIENLNLSKTTQRGYVYQSTDEGWKPRLMPLPDIIYNRIPNRDLEKTEIVRKKLRACKKDNRISLFNPYFFNKWELFKWLKNSTLAKQYLPHTTRLTTSEKLENMLNRHFYLYLKPESGKAGKGIMNISFKPDSALPYRLHIQQKSASTSYSCVNFNKLWARISAEVEKTPYIIQQGINLATYRERKFDLRVLVQKNNLGAWEMTGIGARVAGNASITTHVPRGGRIDDPYKLLSYAFNASESHTIIDKVSKAAVTLAAQIEKYSKHRLAEMSMDIGVDKQGNVWFFEANSKPMKFDEPHIRQKSLQRIFHYSEYLTNS